MPPAPGHERFQQMLLSYRRVPVERGMRVVQAVGVALLWLGLLLVLWSVPVPASLLQPGALAVFALALAFTWYYKHSREVALGLLPVMLLVALACFVLAKVFDPLALRGSGIAMLVIGLFGLLAAYRRKASRMSLQQLPETIAIIPAHCMLSLLQRFKPRAD